MVELTPGGKDTKVGLGLGALLGAAAAVAPACPPAHVSPCIPHAPAPGLPPATPTHILALPCPHAQVTNDNKRAYVNLVARHRMTTAIRGQIDAFLKGFWEIVPRQLVRCDGGARRGGRGQRAGGGLARGARWCGRAHTHIMGCAS